MKDEVFVVLVRDENGGEAFVKDTLIDAIALVKTAEVSVVQDIPTFQSMKGMVGANKDLQLEVIKELERSNVYKFEEKNGKECYIFYVPEGEQKNMPFVILGFSYLIGSIITCAIGIVLLMKKTKE